MGLVPLQIMDDPRRDPNKEVHVYESHNDVGNACITVVAVVEGFDRRPRGGIDDDVREWTAYWMAFPVAISSGGDTDEVLDRHKAERVARTRNRGNKITRDVAEAMFPRLAEYYFRE